jgi:Na+/phosphate symporter
MSYRNPEIIVDRSAEIFAQGMSNLGQTMVQGVQNIYKQREEKKIAIKKQQDAINVFTQKLRGDYNEKIGNVALGIKDKSFAEQYIAEQTSSYEDLIKDQARLAFNPGSFSKEQIADLNKRVAEVTSRDAAAKEFATNVALD